MKTKKVSKKLAAWLAGEGNANDLPVIDQSNDLGYPYLRVLGDKVETSDGKKIDLKTVKDVLPDVLKGITAAENGKGTTVEMESYGIRIDPPIEGKVVVGCGELVLTFTEARDFADKVMAYNPPKANAKQHGKD